MWFWRRLVRIRLKGASALLARTNESNAFRLRQICTIFCTLMVFVALSGFGCEEDEAETPQAIPGSKTGSERWVVYFGNGDVDLTAYRAARAEGKSTESIEEDLRAKAKERYKEFESKLAGFDGTVVDYWYLTPAVTVEIPSGARGTLKTLPGVTEIKPDQWID